MSNVTCDTCWQSFPSLNVHFGVRNEEIRATTINAFGDRERNLLTEMSLHELVYITINNTKPVEHKHLVMLIAHEIVGKLRFFARFYHNFDYSRRSENWKTRGEECRECRLLLKTRKCLL
jgi:hypothetical protein